MKAEACTGNTPEGLLGVNDTAWKANPASAPTSSQDTVPNPVVDLMLNSTSDPQHATCPLQGSRLKCLQGLFWLSRARILKPKAVAQR